MLFAAGPNLYGYVDSDPVNLADPRGLCPPSVTGLPCTPGGVTYLRPVSNPTIRAALEEIARETNTHVTVHSGDRAFNPSGSNDRSEHRLDLGGLGAADFHLFCVDGEQITDEEAVQMIFFGGLNPDGGLPPGTRLIHHGPGTNTEGPHLHLDTRTDIGNRYEVGGIYTQPHVDRGLW